MSSKTRDWRASFFTIWTGQQISVLGSMLAEFALIWYVTKLTGSATRLATLTLVYMIPQIILGPFIGALVDRWNRRLVMLVADSIIAVLAAWLAYLFWTGALQLWHIYVMMFVRSFLGSFHWPAMAASTSLMVPHENLSRVAGMNQTMHGIWAIVSPPLGALLLELIPLHAIMAIDVVTAVCAIIPLFFVTIPQPARQLPTQTELATSGKSGLLADVRSGFAYVWRWRGLRHLLMMAALINFLLNPAFSLLPILVTRHFEKGALALSWMNSAWGIGLVAGGLILSVWGGFKRRILTSMMGLFGMGLGTLVIGMAPASAFYLAVGAMFFTGVMNPMTNGPLHAILQSAVAPDMQGRVLTVVSSAASGMSMLSMAVAGPIVDRWGVSVWYIAGGIICVAMAVSALFSKDVMSVETPGATPGFSAERTAASASVGLEST